MKRAMIIILIIGVIGLAYKLIKGNFYQNTNPASYYNANRQTVDSIILHYKYMSQNLGEFPAFRRAGDNGEIFIFQMKDNNSGFRVVSTKDSFEFDVKKNFNKRVDQSYIIPLIKHLVKVNALYFQKLEEPCRVYVLGYENISLLDR